MSKIETQDFQLYCFSTSSKKQDSFSQIDVFRNLNLGVKLVEVNSADLKIDSHTAKTLINFTVQITFVQTLSNQIFKISKNSESGTSDQIEQTISFTKTHKQIKYLSEELGRETEKIKEMPKE